MEPGKMEQAIPGPCPTVEHLGRGRVVLPLRLSGFCRNPELCANHHGHCYFVCSHIILVASKEGLATDGNLLDLDTTRRLDD